MLDYRFSGTKRSGYGCDTSLSDGEQGVYHSLACDKRHIGRKLFLIGAAGADRPFLHQSDFTDGISRIHRGDRLFNGEIACFNGYQPALYPVGNHDFMGNNGRFLNCTDDITGLHFIPGTGCRDELPFQVPFQRRDLYPPL